MITKSPKKAYAAVIVAIMVLSAVVPMASWDDSDAYDTVSGVLRNASDYQYEYTLSISNGNLVVNTVKGKAYDMTTAWSDDGYGPFNSFYAAFDPTAGNKMVCHLDPNDLTKDIRGNTVQGIGGYNVMWVIPTVYWFTDSSGVLHLTNVKTTGAEAYAHTIDGHTYNYLAIGVYEACFGTADGKYSSTYVSGGKLLSLSGVAPASNQTRATFRTLACSQINTDGVGGSDGYSMLWNFYQWELYKYCSYAVMGGFDSQSIVGQGKTSGSSSNVTGLTDAKGAYWGAGTTTDSVKMFIENSWGSVWEFVDGAVFNNSSGIWISQSSNPTHNPSWTSSSTDNPFTPPDHSEYKALSIPSTGGLSKVNTSDPKLWGYGDSNGTSATTNDNIWSGGQNLVAGGSWHYGSGAGVSVAYSYDALGFAAAHLGARSAFVFDAAGPAAQGSLSTYSYVLSISGGNLSVSDAMDPSAVLQTISNSSLSEMNAKWTSDGYGPFNSYYAAFDPSNGNRMVCRLDPDDLTKDIRGNTVANIGSYNIMWVLPTVYWYTDTQGGLHLSDNPLEGQAYAHTIDGKVYNYLAIGVYEAYSDGTSLKSVSGQTPASKMTRETFRNLAKGSVDSDGDGTSDGYSMLWNFYQWELYKYCSYAVMGGLDSQAIVGQGNAPTSGAPAYNVYNATQTGLLDGSGAYASRTGTDTSGSGAQNKSSVKMFIENSWGSVWEFVDGAVFNNSSGIWISQSSNPTHKSSWTSSPTYNPFTPADHSEYKALSIPSTGGLSKVNTSDPKLWGYGDSNGTSATTNDNIWSGSQNLIAGGSWYNGSGAGVSAAYSNYALGDAFANVGARSAFVFDAAGPAASGTSWSYSSGVLTVTGDTGDFNNPEDVPWIGCGIKQIVIESGCASIGQNAFAYDSQVRSIIFKGTSLPSMADTSLPASKNCRAIFNGEQWSVHGNTLYRTVGDTLYLECNGTTDGWDETDDPWGTGTSASCRKVILGSGVTGLGDYTFKGFSNLWSIDTSKITHLGDGVFSGCSSLTYLDLSGMTSILEDMLKGLTVRKVSDNAQGQYRLYCYKLSIVDGNLSVKEMDRLGNETTPVSIKNNGGTFSQGSWSWDTATGLGPFGSYYATFTSAGTLHQLLNPGDLTKYIAVWDKTNEAWDYTQKGSSSITTEDTMWVLPTVYLKVVDGSLVLSNDPESGGEAYAHTIDGKTYGNIAIGVYEAYKDGNGLKSVSGKSPTSNLTRAAFRTVASGTMDADGDGTSDGYSMLWNFYQWELYKYCSYAVMGGLDSQAIVGQGKTSGSSSNVTGLTNTNGAYWGASTTTDSVKMFIENSWGSVWEFVDGAVFADSGASVYVSQKSVPADDQTESQYVTKLSVGTPSVPSGQEVTHVTTSDARYWGYATGTSGTQASTGDKVWYGNQNLFAGGSWNHGSGAGVSAAVSINALGSAYATFGARSAFVFDAADPAAPCTVYTPNLVTIGDDAFKDQTQLTTVSLHKVTSVGDSAFKGCASLGTVTITSDTGTDFGENAFESSGCSDGLVLTSKVKSIGKGAFAHSNVRSINSDVKGKVVLEGPQSIPEDAFYQTKKVKTFESSTVKTVETNGFSGSVFSKISLSAVTTVRDYAFSGCSELKALAFGSTSVQSVGQYAFSGSGSAQSFVITGSMVNIGQYAFQGSKISGINPDSTYDFKLTGTKSIGKGAFSGSAVTSVSLPDLTGNLTEDVFRNCPSLTKADMPEFAEGIPDNAFNGCAKLETFSGPKATSVGVSSFMSCPKLSQVTLSASCTSVGESAFEGCESYDASDIVKNLTVINKSAFKGTGTVKVEGPSGQTIGEKAFSGCISLTAVDSDAVSIGERAFESCASLLTIELDSMTGVGMYAFAGCNSLTSVSAAVLTSVPGYAFQNCGALNQVSMGSLVTVGDYAFDSCGITKFNSAESKSIFGDGMSIGNYAFRNNPFGALVLGDNVSIGEYSFSRCTMTTLDAGNVSTISSWAFSGCTNLRDVTMSDVGTIATGAFKDCNSMKTLNIGNVQTIMGGAFEDCTGLTSITAGKATTLSSGAFENCTALKSFSAEYVKNIGSSAFKGCSSLTKFTDHTKSDAQDAGMSYMTRTESIGTDAFSGTAITSLCTASLKSLSKGAFEGMASLTEAVIQVDPDSTLNTLPDNTFKGCTSLLTVHLCSDISGVGNDVFPSQNMTVYWCSSAAAPQLPANVTVISSATSGVSYGSVTLKGGDPIQVRRVIQGSKFVLPYGASGESVDTVLALKDSDGNRKELASGRSGDVLTAYTQNSNSMSFEADDPNVTNGFEVNATYEGEGQPFIGKTVQWTVSDYGQIVVLPVPADVEGSKFTNYEGTVSKKVFKDGENETIQNPIPVVMTFYESSFELMSDSAEYTVRFEYNKSLVDVGKPAVEKVYKKGDPIATISNPLPETVEVAGYVCLGWCYSLDPNRPVQNSDQVLKNMTVYLMFEQKEITMTIKSSYNEDVLATVTSKQYVDVTVYNRGDANGGRILVSGNDVEISGDYYEKSMGNLFDSSKYANEFGYTFKMVNVSTPTTVPRSYGDSDSPGQESTGKIYDVEFTITVVFEPKKYDIVFESYMLGTSSVIEDGPDKSTIKIDGKTYAGGKYKTGLNHKQIQAGVAFPIQKISVRSYSFSELKMYSGTTYVGTYNTSSTQVLNIDDAVFGSNTVVTLKLYFETGKYVIRYDTTDCSSLSISNSPSLSDTADVSSYNYKIPDGSEETRGYTFKGWVYKDINGEEHDVTSELAASGNKFSEGMKQYGNQNDMFIDFYAKWDVNKYAVKYIVTDQNGDEIRSGLSETTVSINQTFPSSFRYDDGGVSKTMDLSDVKLDYHDLVGWEYTYGMMIDDPEESPLTKEIIAYVSSDKPVVGDVHTSGTVELTTIWEKTEYTLVFNTGSTSIEYRYDSQTKAIGDLFTVPDAGIIASMYPLHTLSEEPCWIVSKDELPILRFQSLTDHNLDESILKYQKDGKITFTVFWIYSSYNISYSKGSHAGETQGVLPETSETQYRIGTKFPVSPTTYEDEGKQVPYLKRTGYTLVGWNYVDGASTYLSGEVTLTEDMASIAQNGRVILYPVWMPLIYSISYEFDGGSSDNAPEQVEFGVEFEISTPVKTGFKFAGWTADVSTLNTQYAKYRSGSSLIMWAGTLTRATEFINLTDSTTVPVSMVAHWTESEYSIVYDGNYGNGGSGEADTSGASKKAFVNTEITLAKPGTLKKPGYTFAGWSLDGVIPLKTDDEGKVMFTDSMSSYANDRMQITIYAVWAVNSYKVQYKVYEGSADTSTKAYYDIAVPIGIPERTGYVFEGWRLSSVSGGTFSQYASFSIDGKIWSDWPSESGFTAYGMYVKNLTDDPDATVNLIGQWSLRDYTLVYNANGGKGTVPSESGGWSIGDTLTLPEPTSLTKDGYEFAGWSMDRENKLDKTKFDEFMAESADSNYRVVLYALWSVGTYTVLSKDTSESEEVSTTVQYNASFKLTVIDRPGYEFVGWSSDDASPNVAMYSRDGESWFGWTDPTIPVVATYFKNLSPAIGGEVHITGQWDEKEYTVQYSANGGTGTVPTDSNTYHMGEEFKPVDVKDVKLEKKNKTFVGWAYEIDALYASDITKVDEEMVGYADKAGVIVLYAVWSDGTYKVRMSIGDAMPSSVPSGWKNTSAGVYEKEALYGESVKDYIAEWDNVQLQLDGYKFVGWNTDQSKVLSDVTVTAMFTPINQSNVYILVGVIVAIIALLFAVTRIERN